MCGRRPFGSPAWGRRAPVEARLVAAKACSFILNLLALPALYVFARRRYGCRVAIWTMARSGRSSGPCDLCRIRAAREPGGADVDSGGLDADRGLHAEPGRRAIWAWAVAAGSAAGLAVLSRTTALALLAAAGLFAVVVHGRRRFGPLLLWGAIAAVVCLPWAWATLQEYGIALLFVYKLL